MSLSASIKNTAVALGAQSSAMQSISRNIARSSDPHASREIAGIKDLGLVRIRGEAHHLGIKAQGGESIRNFLLDKQISREMSTAEEIGQTFNLISLLETYLGEDVSNGISASSIDSDNSSLNESGFLFLINNFFESLRRFSTEPKDDLSKELVLSSAKRLSSRFNEISSRLTALDVDVKSDIDLGVKKVNDLLSQVGLLNTKIANIEVGSPNSAVGFRDERQKLIEKLSEFIDFEIREDSGSNGQISLWFKDDSSNDVQVLNKGSVEKTLSYDGTSFSVDSGSTIIGFSAGKIYASDFQRKNSIQSSRDQLDKIARQLVESVNENYNPTNTVGSNFFDASNTQASNISLDASLNISTLKATNSTDSKENDLALEVFSLKRKVFSVSDGDQFDGTFFDYYIHLVNQIGADLQKAKDSSELQDQVLSSLRNRRDSEIGISMDEEVASITKFQHAYMAMAQMIRTFDEMNEIAARGFRG